MKAVCVYSRAGSRPLLLKTVPTTTVPPEPAAAAVVAAAVVVAGAVVAAVVVAAAVVAAAVVAAAVVAAAVVAAAVVAAAVVAAAVVAGAVVAVLSPHAPSTSAENIRSTRAREYLLLQTPLNLAMFGISSISIVDTRAFPPLKFKALSTRLTP
jgi:hypothetical protein